MITVQVATAISGGEVMHGEASNTAMTFKTSYFVQHDFLTSFGHSLSGEELRSLLFMLLRHESRLFSPNKSS